MRWLGAIQRRLVALFRRRRLEQDLDDELAFHVAMREAEHVRNGLALERARTSARREVGNVTLLKEQARDAWVLPLVESWWQDVRYAVRALMRNPAFSVVAIITLALGIGATTAIYSVVDTILLRPLPFPDSDRLVRVVENVPSVVPGRAPNRDGVSSPGCLEWRANSKALADAACVAYIQAVVRTSEGTTRLWGGMTSANIFSLLGMRAMLGRTLGPGDEGNPLVVVLSFAAWQRLFNADSGVVGKTIELREPDQRLMTVVGVLPEGFEFPTGKLMDFYTPFLATGPPRRISGDVLGRLRPGVPLQSATDESNTIGSAIPRRNPNAPPLKVPRFGVEGLKDEMVQDMRPALRVFLAAVGAVLLIVCANVANLLLARGTARQREMAVRFAIGANRGRIVRQVLSECFVLAMVGGALGALLGAAGTILVRQLATIEAPGIFRVVFGASILPRGNELGIDLRMLRTAFGIAGIACLIFGMLPALQLSRTDHLHAMGSRGGGHGRGESRIREGLVVGQLVMATVLLVGAGLLAHSFVNLSAVDNGYDVSNVLAFQLVLPSDYSASRKSDTVEGVLARIRATPDIESAGFTRAGILIPEEILVGTFVPTGRTLAEMQADSMQPRLRPVSHGYLSAMGVRLLAGREFETADGATARPVIVISRSVARRYFGAGNPIGQIVDWQFGNVLSQMQVVGVVEDVRNESPDREAAPNIFVDYRQVMALMQARGMAAPRQDNTAMGFLSVAVRTKDDPASAGPMVSQIVRSVDPNAGIDAMIPMERLVGSSIARQRFYMVLLGVFAGVAGLLAAIGIYGTLAYAVVQRTQEMGIRMALGAQRHQVLTLVLGKGLVLAAVGIALGLAGAAAVVRILQGMLFGIAPLDPKTFVAVPLVFGLVAALACYLPARRATKVDPLVALRCD